MFLNPLMYTFCHDTTDLCLRRSCFVIGEIVLYPVLKGYNDIGGLSGWTIFKILQIIIAIFGNVF